MNKLWMSNKKHIVVTGPESTGKSTLSQILAKEYNGLLVEEFARKYLSENSGQYKRSDLLKIAYGQFQSQLAAINNQDFNVVISDTCLLTIRIWDEWKYGLSEPFIEEWIGLQEVDLYLLCSPDLGWESDDLRESENDLDELFEIYLENIIKTGIPYSIVEGVGQERNQEAINIVGAFL